MTVVIERRRRRASLRLLTLNGLLALVWVVSGIVGNAESINSLAQVKTLYVSPFSGGEQADRLREKFIRHLAGSRFKLVQSAKSADAVLTGTVEIWVKGYISVNPRSASTERQAVYAGYLSVEVSRPDGEPLWSSLVTPRKLQWSDIDENLASNGAKKLVEAAAAAPEHLAGDASSPSGALAKTNLTAAGATFPDPLYRKWFEDFGQQHPEVHVSYSPIGSQSGVEKLVAREIDFAGSDVVPAVAVGTAAASQFQVVATVVGAVVPIYNLRGVTGVLQFSPELLADIYMGRVHKWNDEAIRRLNKQVHLPDSTIKVFHRSDGSGTTWIWSDYLSKTSPTWLSAVGRGTTLHWPIGTGAEGNDGVAKSVLTTPDSIGYVELTYAIRHKLSFGAVRNRSGQFIQANLESLAEAAKAPAISDEHAHSLTDSPAKFAYPIAAFTWMVVPVDLPDPAKRVALTELLKWILTSGQRACSSLGYEPLPREVVDRQLRLVESVRHGQ